jgi:hypothetical protein
MTMIEPGKTVFSDGIPYVQVRFARQLPQREFHEFCKFLRQQGCEYSKELGGWFCPDATFSLVRVACETYAERLPESSRPQLGLGGAR